LDAMVCRFSAPVQNARVTALAITSDATHAWVALDNGRLIEGDLDTNTITRAIPLGSHVPVTALRLSADDKYVTSTTSTEICEWDLVGRTRLRTLQVPSCLACHAAVTPGGTYAVENCHTYFAVINIDSHEQLIEGDHYGYIKAAIISADGANVVSIGDSGNIILWSVRDGNKVAELPICGASAAMLIPQGNRVLFDCVTFFVDVCEMKDGAAPRMLGPFGRRPVLFGSGAGGEFCILDNWPDLPSILDVKSGGPPFKISGKLEHPYASCMAVGYQKIAVGFGSSICLWDRNTWGQPQQLDNERWAATSLAFTADEAQLLTGYVDGEVALWDIASGRKLWSRRHHTKEVKALAIAPAKGLLLSGGRDYAVKVTELATGKEQAAFYLDEGVTCAALTQDASIAVVGTSSGVLHFFHTENL